MSDTDKILTAINEIKEDIHGIKKDIKTLDMKVTLHTEQSKKDHIQLVEMIEEGNEITHQVFHHKLKKLEERITTIENQIQGKN